MNFAIADNFNVGSLFGTFPLSTKVIRLPEPGVAELSLGERPALRPDPSLRAFRGIANRVSIQGPYLRDIHGGHP